MGAPPLDVKPRLPALTDRLELRPGVRVSPFCLGLSDPATVRAAYDAGINFFFLTADMHWPEYEGTRRGIYDLLASGIDRDAIVVAVVSYVTQPEFCFAPFEEVLLSVPKLDRIDLAVIGGIYSDNFLVRQRIYEANVARRYCGFRALAGTFHERAVAEQAVRTPLLDAAFIRYNSDHPGAERDVLAATAKASARPKIFSFKTASGWVSPERCKAIGLPEDKWQPAVTDHYRFAITPRDVDGILCALQTPAHVKELEAALARGPLDEEERQYLKDLSDFASGRAQLES